MKLLKNKLLLCVLLISSMLNAQDYKTHTVTIEETVYSIATKYQTTVDKIIALNPDASNSIQPNMVLIIPINANEEQALTKELNGFKEHKVKRKETLFSLSKKYNVSEEDIKKHNPHLYAKQLKKREKIKIPVYNFVKIEPKVKTTKPYIVKPAEGKWRIAYKFGITVDELNALNPNVGEILQDGQLIMVPNINYLDEKPIDDNYSYYKVLPAEGFFRLKVKLGIEQEELERLNPGLKESGLQDGMILKVPKNEAVETITTNVESTETSIKSNLALSVNNYTTKHIAVMLPFRLERLTDSIEEAKEKITKDPFLNPSLEFHSGVLLAADSLKRMGISLKLDVYDTSNKQSKVASIISTNNFETVEAVIGPFMSKNIDQVALLLAPKQIPVISPVSKKVTLRSNIYQTRPSQKLLKNKLVNYVKKDSLANIVIISDAKNRTLATQLKSIFVSASEIFSRKHKTKGTDLYHVLRDDVKEKLKDGKNIVFLETQNEGFASNVSSILNSFISAKQEVQLVTTNINKAFQSDEISNDHLSNLNFTYPSMSRSYDAESAFVKQYKEQYNIAPSKLASRGFDLMMDVVLRLAASKNIETSITNFGPTEYVENKFDYKKEHSGGYTNTAVYLVCYKDLNIVEIKEP